MKKEDIKMLSINRNFNSSQNVNFKSCILDNAEYRSALNYAENNLYIDSAHPEKGIELINALYGIFHDRKKYNFIEFHVRDNKVLTLENEKINKKYTLKSTGNKGLDTLNAIVNYAKHNEVYSKRPISLYEEKVAKAQKALDSAKKKMYDELRIEITQIKYNVLS
ncbi:TPA: hypothetical protein IAD52_08825 [Candidatus Spyradomonas excrementavium]|nr:hypothetical protein [Candidatus Spyradomonas excrementavium]